MGVFRLVLGDQLDPDLAALKDADKAADLILRDFLARNEERLKGNHRLAMPYRTLKKMDGDKVDAMRASSRKFLDAL